MDNYNAIVFFKPEKLMKPRKYHNISKVDNFSIFCLTAGAWYINFYNSKTKEFIKRIYINE
jgi:hypothetical protein